MRAGVLAAVVALSVTACAREKPSLEQPLAAQIAGCAALVEPYACELPTDRRVRVFVPSGSAPAFSVDGAALIPEASEVVDGGTLFRLTLPPQARSLAVVRLEGTGRTGAYRIPLVHASRAWLDEAKALRRAGKLAEARAAAERGRDTGTASDRALAIGFLARLALGRGDVDEGLRGLSEAIERDAAAGRISDRIDDGFALAFTLHQRLGRYADAEAALSDVEPLLARYPEGWARAPLYVGQLAMDTGRPRLAFRSLADAELRARRLGLARLARNARNLRATSPLLLGHQEQGLVLLRGLMKELEGGEDVTPCERAEVAINATSAALRLLEVRLARGAGVDRALVDEVGALSRRAVELTGPACSDPRLRAVALGSAAWRELLAGDAREALRVAREARAIDAHPRVREQFLSLEVEARALLRTEDVPGALALAGHAEGLAMRSGLPDVRYRAELLRGEALEASRRPAEALDAYLAAERVLEEASVSVPLEEGRSAFLGQGERSASRAVSLLLARSRAAEALDVVRRARSRTLRMLALSLSGVGASLEAESELRTALLSYWESRAALLEAAGSDWRLARSSLEAERVARLARERELRRALDDTLSSRVPFGVAVAPLSRVPGELVLAYVSTREGDVGLASLGDRTLAFPRRPLAPGAGPDELAASLLGPVRALVAAATRVRIVPGGLGRDVDFASLPFDGRPLVAHAPVVVGLDVPGRARVGEGGAVVVADPLENLPSAREEGRAVTKLLRDAGLAVRHLEGDAATSAGIVEALGRATRLHFAGHGAFAGTEGLDGYLALARGERLSVSDVLAARDAPDVVFLSSCETGRTDASIDVQSLGFAQAFVVAGARAVVAPVRAVDDQASARLAARVYAVLPEPAEGLRRAQLADPGPDASAFRVFVP